jgi:hypothetical protein
MHAPPSLFPDQHKNFHHWKNLGRQLPQLAPIAAKFQRSKRSLLFMYVCILFITDNNVSIFFTQVQTSASLSISVRKWYVLPKLFYVTSYLMCHDSNPSTLQFLTAQCVLLAMDGLMEIFGKSWMLIP